MDSKNKASNEGAGVRTRAGWSTGIKLVASAAALCAGLVFSVASTAGATGQTDVWDGSPLVVPVGVAVDSHGNLFVADAGAGKVWELVRSGQTYDTPVKLPFKNLSEPVGVAVDSLGNVYVTDPGTSGQVLMLPKQGSGWGKQKHLPFGGTNFTPIGIAVDGAGNVYVTDDENYPSLPPHVLFLQQNPSKGSGYDAQQVLPIGGLEEPTGIAVDQVGNVFVVDTETNHVFMLPKTNTGYGSQLTVPIGGLSDPTGLLVQYQGSGDTIYVVDTGNGVVRYLSYSPGIGFSTPQLDPAFGGLEEPTGIAQSNSGNIFLSDSGHDRVLELPISAQQ